MKVMIKTSCQTHFLLAPSHSLARFMLAAMLAPLPSAAAPRVERRPHFLFPESKKGYGAKSLIENWICQRSRQ